MNYQQTTKNLIQQTRNYFRKAGKENAILGLSGGIDSAVSAAISARALGKENTWGISMPYADQSTEDADLVVRTLGIRSHEVNIENIVNDFDFLNLKKLGKGNIKARVRMTILYGFAEKLNGLVVGTGNKSELEIGYITKYGDGGVDIEPLGNLYKTEVKEVAKVLGLPKKIIEKTPSAELWEGQTDENELGMNYEELDAVLKGKITQGKIYEKVQKMRKISTHKKNMPPLFKVK